MAAPVTSWWLMMSAATASSSSSEVDWRDTYTRGLEGTVRKIQN